MAITVYPLNDIDYTAEDVAIYNSTRTSGIYAGDDFAISMTGADNTISIDVGLAWMRLSKFNGVALALKAKTAIDMGIPDATYPRIDALVLQFDANKNGAEIVSKSGAASSSPRPPALSQTEALYELHLLHVLRQPGATSITAADVTDLRMDEAYCGLMADSVTRVDTAAINAQISELINQLREELAAVKAETAFVMKSGDVMTGPLSLPAPTLAEHAVNKGYVDGKVVNNFTTTEEGFVADARALKALNDSKLSMELLWENASPQSEFAKQTVSLDLSEYDMVEISFNLQTGVLAISHQLKCKVDGGRVTASTPGTTKYARRSTNVSMTGINFGDCSSYSSSNDATTTNGSLIPVYVYGIKGVSV